MKLFYLYLTVFINVIGFSMVFPMLPFYALEFNATPLQIGFLAASHALANFLFSPILGRLSDRLGRRTVLIFGLFAGTVAFMLMGFATNLLMLLVGRVAHGIVAAAIMPTARAYAGDISSPSQRVVAMGRFGAVMGFGFLVGPAFSSFLVGLGQITTPFFVSAAISFINAVSVYLFLPESLKQKIKNVGIKEGMKNTFLIFNFLKGPAGIFFMVLFCWAFALSNHQVAFPLLLENKFNLGAAHVGYFFTAAGLVGALIQGCFLKIVIKRLGERVTLFIGLLIMGVAMFLIPLSPTIALLSIFFTTMHLGGSLNRPTAEGIISRSASVGQGTIMGISHSFESLGRVIGPSLGGILYGFFPGAPFFLTGFMLLGLSIVAVTSMKIPEAGSVSEELLEDQHEPE